MSIETQRAIEEAVNSHDDLVAACNAVDNALMPYRGPDASDERTYLLSRAAVKQLRAAIAKAKSTTATVNAPRMSHDDGRGNLMGSNATT